MLDGRPLLLTAASFLLAATQARSEPAEWLDELTFQKEPCPVAVADDGTILIHALHADDWPTNERSLEFWVWEDPSVCAVSIGERLLADDPRLKSLLEETARSASTGATRDGCGALGRQACQDRCRGVAQELYGERGVLVAAYCMGMTVSTSHSEIAYTCRCVAGKASEARARDGRDDPPAHGP